MAGFNLEKLIDDVFMPTPDDVLLVMSDRPHSAFKDNDKWIDRRRLAVEWHAGLTEIGLKGKYRVSPMLHYAATGRHNGDLPETGLIDGKEITMDEAIRGSSIILSMAEYSASAPLIIFTKRHEGLRAASMPMLERRMEKSGLSADYKKIARECTKIKTLLESATSSDVIFSTGHKCHFDLRYRKAISDDGQLSRAAIREKGFALINLPCGEVCKCPYEGEKNGIASNTAGEIPFVFEGELVVFNLEGNRIVGITGDGPQADFQRDFFEIDPARRNVAEFAIGCNDRAEVTGNPLEDEKAKGFHWAYGRSDHIGGIFGPDKFSDPSHVHHLDLVYARKSRIYIRSLVLEYEDKASKEIIREGEVLV